MFIFSTERFCSEKVHPLRQNFEWTHSLTKSHLWPNLIGDKYYIRSYFTFDIRYLLIPILTSYLSKRYFINNERNIVRPPVDLSAANLTTHNSVVLKYWSSMKWWKPKPTEANQVGSTGFRFRWVNSAREIQIVPYYVLIVKSPHPQRHCHCQHYTVSTGALWFVGY